MKLTTLPKLDRPREKLIRYGLKRLTDTELLALILGSGLPNQNVIELSRKILLKYGGQRLSTLVYGDLVATFGLGPTKAARLVASFELSRRCQAQASPLLLFRPKDVWLALQSIRDHKKEHFVVFYLDGHRQVLHQEIVSVGTINASIVHPREVFEPALTHLASQLIVAHNHPSGSVEPSVDDLMVTERLVSAGRILGIEVIDHIIVTRDRYSSLRERGMLNLP